MSRALKSIDGVLRNVMRTVGVFTLRDLADQINVNRYTVRNWHARRSIPLEHLQAIAKRFNTTVDALLNVPEDVRETAPDFLTITLRLKTALHIDTDSDLADALGLGEKAFCSLKRRGVFPVDKLYALQARRPDLGLDAQSIVNGSPSTPRLAPHHPKGAAAMASLYGLCTYQQLIDYALGEIAVRQRAAHDLLAAAKSGRHDRIAASGVIAEHRDQGCAVADIISSALISLGASDDVLRPLHAARYALHRDLSASVHGVRVVGVEVREVPA